MTRLIVFANRKGGCGKTTTAVNSAHALAEQGKKILLIDVDPQAHASLSNGLSPEERLPGICDLLYGSGELDTAIHDTRIENLKIIPSSRELTRFEIDFSHREGSETILAERIQNIDGFDYLIFDPPPTIGLLTVSCLVAAKEIYIPMPMNFLSMEGLAEMVRLIYTVNATWNPDLRLYGIIPTFFNSQTRITREIYHQIEKNFGKDKIMQEIRMNVTLAEAPGHGKTVLEYAPKSHGAEDYLTLAKQIESAGGSGSSSSTSATTSSSSKGELI